MSSDRINNYSFKSVKRSYKIKEIRSSNKKEIQLKSNFNKVSHDQFNQEYLDDNLALVQCLHLLLANCSNLTHKQRFDFCTSQRYFMKLYLKEVLKKTS